MENNPRNSPWLPCYIVFIGFFLFMAVGIVMYLLGWR